MSAKRSPQLAPVTFQGGVGSRCPASPRHRARCDRHEARARIVALAACCLVRLSNGGLGPPDEIALSSLACTPRITCRGAALASRLGPLSAAAAKLCFLLCSTEHLFQNSEPVSCSCEPDNWAYGRSTFETSAKEIISVRISFCPRAASLDWPPRCGSARLLQSREPPSRLVTDSSFFAVTQQQWRACVRRMLRCRLACILPPSSLGPRLDSGAVPVAEDEDRGTNSLETDVHWIAVRKASGIRTCLTIHGYVA